MNKQFPFLNTIIDRFKTLKSDQRFLVGITGIPGSGKSSLADKLPGLVNNELQDNVATFFNMDGYHHYNKYLIENGIQTYKGAHFTFNSQKFIKKLIEIKEVQKPIYCPIYDREIHNPIENKNIIESGHKIVFVEGNYLLTSVFPWYYIKHILDYSIYIDVNDKIQLDRLKDRHLKGGRNIDEALIKINHTDLPNSRLIEESKSMADYIFKPDYNF